MYIYIYINLPLTSLIISCPCPLCVFSLVFCFDQNPLLCTFWPGSTMKQKNDTLYIIITKIFKCKFREFYPSLISNSW